MREETRRNMSLRKDKIYSGDNLITIAKSWCKTIIATELPVDSTVLKREYKTAIRFGKGRNPQMISTHRISASKYQVPITDTYQASITEKYQQCRYLHSTCWKWKLKLDLAKRGILRWFLLSGFLYPNTNSTLYQQVPGTNYRWIPTIQKFKVKAEIIFGKGRNSQMIAALRISASKYQ